MESLDTSTPENPHRDSWFSLRSHTAARIALGRAGGSVRTQDLLDFRLAHARARDAVTQEFEAERVIQDLNSHGLASLRLSSRASSRREFLLRPDLGRQLSDASRQHLATHNKGFDVAIILSDGLSPLAAERQGPSFVADLVGWLRASGLNVAPVVVLPFGRVKIQDEIGTLLRAKLTLMALGERPGLAAPDSLGVYFTWNPRAEATDADRNCISNVRPEGFPLPAAAEKTARLVAASFLRGVSGVALKDDESLPLLPIRDALGA